MRSAGGLVGSGTAGVRGGLWRFKSWSSRGTKGDRSLDPSWRGWKGGAWGCLPRRRGRGARSRLAGEDLPPAGADLQKSIKKGMKHTSNDRGSGIPLDPMCHEMKVCVPAGRIHPVEEFLKRGTVRIDGQVIGDRVHRRYKGAELTEPH